MASFGDIAEKVAAYVNGALPFERFLEWFVPVAWRASELDDAAAQKLIRRVELEWAEYSQGHSSKSEFDSALQGAVEEALARFKVRTSMAAPALPGAAAAVGIERLHHNRAAGRGGGRNVEAESNRLDPI